MPIAMRVVTIAAAALMLSHSAAPAKAAFPVIDSGSIPLTVPDSVFWLDENRIVFIAIKQSPPLPQYSADYSLTQWDVGKKPTILHQLQRAWELHHRLLASESVTQHTLFREEARWSIPGRSHEAGRSHWHCFTRSRYDRHTGEWAMEKAPVYHIID